LRPIAAWTGLVVGVLPILTPKAAAQESPLLLGLPASTRAAALGNAFPLGSGSAGSLFYHPGLLESARGMSASVSLYDDNARLLAVAGGGEWWSGGVAIGLQVLDYGAAPMTRTYESALVTEAPQDASEAVISVGYGRALFGIQWGIAGKLVEYRTDGRRDGTAALDAGAAFDLGPVLLAASIQNVGPDLTMAGTDFELPLRGSLAATTDDTQLGPLDIGGTAAVVVDRDGEVAPSVGLEVGWWPVLGRTYLARIGYRRLPADPDAIGVTLGGGFRGDQIRVDYAYEPFEDRPGVHRVGLGFR
jgi:hypothetical protein